MQAIVVKFIIMNAIAGPVESIKKNMSAAAEENFGGAAKYSAEQLAKDGDREIDYDFLDQCCYF